MLKKNPLQNTILSHHEIGNEYCRYCDRSDVLFPIPCHCGGLVHRQGDISDRSRERYVEICDVCGGKNEEEESF